MKQHTFIFILFLFIFYLKIFLIYFLFFKVKKKKNDDIYSITTTMFKYVLERWVPGVEFINSDHILSNIDNLWVYFHTWNIIKIYLHMPKT